jgi:hypothetical protein
MSVKVATDSVNDISLLFVNPFMIDFLKRNPFSAEKRIYPVDFQIRSETIYNYTLTIPDTFVFDEVPENVFFALPDGLTSYSLVVTKTPRKITLTAKRKMGKSVFAAAEYNSLREFFAHVVQVQDAQIVIRKE